ncbi:Ku protein [Streptomyces sp. NPDC056190]|uniref:Ku protein n=1 Tax=Streptomyces sp. NPDC056190 TaxID=3345741 RepID=UPI0035D6448B
MVLEEADLQALPLPSKHVIDVLGFVPVDGLDPILFSRAYYAAPHGQAGQQPYALLVAALTRAERAAVAKATLRTREPLAAVRPRSAGQGQAWRQERSLSAMPYESNCSPRMS